MRKYQQRVNANEIAAPVWTKETLEEQRKRKSEREREARGDDRDEKIIADMTAIFSFPIQRRDEELLSAAPTTAPGQGYTARALARRSSLARAYTRTHLPCLCLGGKK